MLPKKNRLTQKKDFDTVFKSGKTIKGDFLIFKLLKNHLGENRFGFIVSKKVSNRATKRNLVKRKLRQAVTKAYQEGVVREESLDVVMFALPNIIQKDSLEIEKTISSFFKKYK